MRLRRAILPEVLPAVHPNKQALRKALKVRLAFSFFFAAQRGFDASLSSRCRAFERVCKFWAANIGVWCALDFEEWVEDHSAITEFGYSSIHWSDGAEVKDLGHFTVWENRMKRNGKHYSFGTSEEITNDEFKAKIADLLSGLQAHGPILLLFLVFHNPNQDIKLESPMDASVQELRDTMSSSGIFILDNVALFGALMKESYRMHRLGQVCIQLGIETEYLHNAGNDAFYTLLALREMALGGLLESQRESRWPDSPTALLVQLPD
ncbi:hypothetical protein DFH07DRAFT_756147 [Mycena maculata]|uniref:Gfd2/YDR514C-like C-terminal domain-containing protein n=1 Tax=Mycena maculata TaxID=230809 RepID=A0AAD7MSH0_9AGAR|nr:hypothetical protein DFH07DRAFT_756147 [Mycena maculata]